jgi:hypothetical protein
MRAQAGVRAVSEKGPRRVSTPGPEEGERYRCLTPSQRLTLGGPVFGRGVGEDASELIWCIVALPSTGRTV